MSDNKQLIARLTAAHNTANFIDTPSLRACLADAIAALAAQEQVARVQDMIINAVRDACSYSYRIGNGLPQNRNTESLYAASEAYAIRYVDAREERLRALAPPYTATKGDA